MPMTANTVSRRFALASLLTLLMLTAMFGAVQSASAADHCVGTHPICVGPNNYPATPAGIQSALSATNNNTNFPGADIVYIGAGTYTMTSTIQVSPNADLAIRGEGAGSTILEAGITNISNLRCVQFDSRGVDHWTDVSNDRVRRWRGVGDDER